MFLLHKIPIDIVEIVIVKSKSFDLFNTLESMIKKLKRINISERIKDKLTICVYRNRDINYYLNYNLYRAYDKPYSIERDGRYEFMRHPKLCKPFYVSRIARYIKYPVKILLDYDFGITIQKKKCEYSYEIDGTMIISSENGIGKRLNRLIFID